MKKELLLLRKLHLNPKITQRDLAKSVGLSLGSVNILIKRMVGMGILQVEKGSQNTIIYRLTPLGIKQKIEGTYKYLSEAYEFLKDFNKNIDDLLSSINNDDMVVLFGERDNLCEVLEMKLSRNRTEYIVAVNYEEIRELSEKNKLLLIVWNPENITLLSNENYKCINLLSCI